MTIQPGTILKSEWGYDQTNIDFYTVTARTAATVTIQRVRNVTVIDHARYLAEEVVPGDTVGKPMRRKIRTWRNEEFVSINSYAIASPWSGKPAYQTHTH